MPYIVKNKCVYKKDGGTKVGCTKGDVNKYLSALHANANESLDKVIEDYKKLKFKIVNEGMFNAAYFRDFGCPNKECPCLKFRKKTHPNINDGDSVYEMHIDIPESLQNKGIAVLMLKAFIYREGCIYFSHGRIINKNVYKVIDKIAKDKSFAVTEEEYGFVICENFFINENNTLKGGKADKINSFKDLYNYWVSKNNSINLKKELEKEIEIGKKIESEHTSNQEKILEIVFDHLIEDKNYYSNPKPKNWGEKEIEKEINELNKSLIKKLIREHLNL